MDKFTVNTREDTETCFVAVNGTPYRIELSEPADFQHAWRVANFLAENVKTIAAGPAPDGEPRAERAA